MPRSTLDGADLLGDLLYMRKGAGFTAERIVDAGTLRHVLGGDEEPFGNLRERFISAISSLRDPEPDLLLSAYGLTSDTAVLPTLKERREHYGRRVNRKVDTIAARENAALEHLRVQLLTGWYPTSPIARRVPEMHNGIVQELVEIQTVVADTRWRETRQRYRFLVVFDEADFLAVSSSYPGRPIPSEGYTVKTERIGESFTHHFYPAQPFRRGHTYELAFTLVPDEGYGQSQVICEESLAFHERTLTASFEVIFLGQKPELVWSFEGLTCFERPGNPTANNRLELGDRSSVRVVQRDLYGGLFGGMAWKW